MILEKMTDIEREKLIECKIPYRNYAVMALSVIGVFSLLSWGILLIGVYQESIAFQILKIHWVLPCLALIVIFIYKAKVRKINHDLKYGFKRVGDFTVKFSGLSKQGTFSTGDYSSAGSSDRFYIEFEDYSYNCPKKDSQQYKIGDSISAVIADKSEIILEVSRK